VIDAVLWDFGGVFTASPIEGLRTYGAQLGVDGDRLFELMFGPYGADTDHPWHRVERGEETLDVALQAALDAVQAAGVEGFDPAAVFTILGSGHAAAREAVVQTVRELKAGGIRHAIVTNNLQEMADSWRALIPVDELFDTVVDSSVEGVRKPNPAIYRLALDRLGVDADRAAFLDDIESNVEGARAVGIHGIVVGADPAPALGELAALIAAG